MKWTFFRRKAKHNPGEHQSTGVATVEPSPASTVTRASVSTGTLARTAPLRDEALRFARDYLLATGAKVRVEGPDLLTATQPDGRQTRYTSSLARARSDPGAELLAPGGETLSAMIADVERRAGVTAFRLAAAHDAREILRRCAPTLPGVTATPDRYVFEEAPDLLAIECAYELHARWRGGASQDVLTVALNARTLEPVAEVDDETLGRASASALPADAATQFERVSSAAHAALSPTLGATGRWLRLRTANELAARQDDLRQTEERLTREAPEDAEAHRLAFERESRRLRDLFAVTVEARLSGVSFIAAPVLVARPKDPASGPALLLDLGRGTTRQLAPSGRPRVPDATLDDPARTALTTDDLTRLPARVWREAVPWLLEQMGHVIVRTEEPGSVQRIHTDHQGRQATVIVLREDSGAVITGAVAREAIDGSVDRHRERLLLTPNALSDDARTFLTSAGLDVLGPDTLRAELDRLDSAYATQQAASLAEAETRAARVDEARSQIIGRLETLETTLAHAANGRRASGAEIATAAGILREVWTLADQVFVAWDTLVADWQSMFPERAARDGSLRLAADDARLAELRERAEHLFAVTQGGFARLAETPGTGEMGYTAWRRTLLEELTARCETLRWRIHAADPSQWRDFARVTDTQALERAESARTSALHARARAEKTYAQLATRARL